MRNVSKLDLLYPSPNLRSGSVLPRKRVIIPFGAPVVEAGVIGRGAVVRRNVSSRAVSNVAAHMHMLRERPASGEREN